MGPYFEMDHPRGRLEKGFDSGVEQDRTLEVMLPVQGTKIRGVGQGFTPVNARVERYGGRAGRLQVAI